MTIAKQDEFLPTMMFGFQLEDDKTVLCQMWVTPLGLSEWRPVPMVELGSNRKPTVAGYLDEDD